MENDMPRRKNIRRINVGGKSRPLTEAILESILKEYFDRFGKEFDSKLKVLEGKLEAKIEFVRQDFKEHLQSVERRLERKIEAVYSELKSTQLAVREVKYESIQHEKRLKENGKRLEAHGKRLEEHGKRLEEQGKRLAHIEEIVERLVA